MTFNWLTGIITRIVQKIKFVENYCPKKFELFRINQFAHICSITKLFCRTLVYFGLPNWTSILQHNMGNNKGLNANFSNLIFALKRVQPKHFKYNLAKLNTKMKWGWFSNKIDFVNHPTTDWILFPPPIGCHGCYNLCDFQSTQLGIRIFCENASFSWKIMSEFSF